MAGLGQAPGLGEGYGQEDGDGRHGVSGIRPGMEWTAAYDRRPARWRQRWSWQNRGGAVDEIAEPSRVRGRPPLYVGAVDELYEVTSAADQTEVPRERVVAALEAWIRATHASQMGRTFGVSQPEGRRAYAEHLAAGPVAAVLEALGYTLIG